VSVDRAPFSDLAVRFADEVANQTMRRMDDLFEEPPNPERDIAAAELDAALLRLCGGCAGRSEMVLSEALSLMNSVYERVSEANAPLHILARINMALLLIFALYRRRLVENPAAGTYH
jgi:hypothetical protein